MKDRSKEKKIKKLETQFYRFNGNPDKQDKILGRIETLKNKRK